MQLQSDDASESLDWTGGPVQSRDVAATARKGSGAKPKRAFFGLINNSRE
jgi:hypothetical protein